MILDVGGGGRGGGVINACPFALQPQKALQEDSFFFTQTWGRGRGACDGVLAPLKARFLFMQLELHPNQRRQTLGGWQCFVRMRLSVC